MSIVSVTLEFLRRRDDKSVVPWIELLLLLLLLLLLKLMLLLLAEAVSCRGDGVGGKKNRRGVSLLRVVVSMERIGLGRKIIEESPSLSVMGLGMILWLLDGDFAIGVWKNIEDAANLFAYCRSNRDRVGEGRGTRIDDCVDVGDDVDKECGDDTPWLKDGCP